MRIAMLRTTVFSVLLALATLASAQTQPASMPDSTRDSALRIIDQIKRADYAGDRAALARLHAELKPATDNKVLASRLLYWRGFALWRRAINGFNETPTPQDLSDDLNGAIADFNDSIAQDPMFADSKIAAASCYGYLMYLNLKDQVRSQELMQHSTPLMRDAMTADPNNPRLLWVLGPWRWSSPPEHGGGQDKAFALYNRGLDIIRKKPTANDPLEPSWGEPELLMNRSWSYLHQTTPDLKAAQQDSEAALAIVPYWHYVRDILLPQIKIEQIKRADYEGDRAALQRLHAELKPQTDDKMFASRILYWRGFALWRRAIDGFDDSASPKELEEDLNGAIADFKDSLAQDPAYVEAKIGAGSCYSYLVYLAKNNTPRVQELIQRSSPLLKDAMASDPDNPRLLWVLGPIRWSSPPERGGGQDKALDLYNRGLDTIHKPASSDPLDPTWGEAELLMNRAWSNLHRTTPDLKAAQKDAEAALVLVPYWHNVRDILLPQIQQAQNKPN